MLLTALPPKQECHLLKVFSISSHRRTSPTKRRWKALTWGFSWKQKEHITRKIFQRSDNIVLPFLWELSTSKQPLLFHPFFFPLRITQSQTRLWYNHKQSIGKESNFFLSHHNSILSSKPSSPKDGRNCIKSEILLVLKVMGILAIILFPPVYDSLCNTP